MKRYVIERELPGVGAMNRDQLKQAAATSIAAARVLPIASLTSAAVDGIW